MTKEEFISKLKEHGVTFDFEKKDGTIREMYATLNPAFITVSNTDSINTRSKSSNENLLHVYDLENKGWRSFYFDKLKNVY